MQLEEIEVGDRVLITRRAKTQERGWGNSWEESMDKHVGQIHTVSGVSAYGVRTQESNGLEFPWFVLRRVETETTEKAMEE